MKTVARRAALALLALSLPLHTAAADTEDFVAGFAGPDSISPSGSDYFLTLDHVTGSGTGPSDWVLGMIARGARVTAVVFEGTDAEPVFDANSTFSSEDHELASTGTEEGAAVQALLLQSDTTTRAPLPAGVVNSVAIVTVVPSSSSVRTPVLLEYSNQLQGVSFIPPGLNPPFFQRVGHEHLFGFVISEPPMLGSKRVRPNNFVPNPELDDGLSSWTGDNATLELSDLDVDGSETSQALLVSLSAAGAGTGGSARSTCLPVSASTGYVIGGSVLVVPGQARAGTTTVDVRWHDDASCTSPIGSNSSADAAQNALYDDLELFVTSPAGALSAELGCTSTAQDATGTYVATCDSLFLPEPGGALAGAGALGALFALVQARARHVQDV